MHLSHITEDLEAWYLNFDFDERVLTAFRPGLTNVKQGAQTVPQGPKDVSAERGARDAAVHTRRAASATARPIQTTSRLLQDVVGPDGTRVPEGHGDPAARRLQHARQSVRVLRATRTRDRLSTRAGCRRALRRLQPVGRRLRAQPARDGRRPARRHEARRSARARARRASTPCSTTTHRQNFLVPPRRHRSFPLAEL